MSDNGIVLERRGQVAVVTFDRQDRANAFNQAMWRRMERVVDDLAGNLPRVVVLTGAGKRWFCGGFDLNPDNPDVAGLVDAVQRREAGPVKKLLRRMRDILDGLIGLPVPLIAALNGNAYGGGAELAARCDVRIVDPHAVIRFSETRYGLMPDWGGCVALTRLVGPSHAADLVLTAREVNAAEAQAMGLANRVSDRDQALREAMEYAEAIASNGPRAVRHALEVIRRTPDLVLNEALALELDRAVALVTSGECIHGVSAFLEKRDPDFPDA